MALLESGPGPKSHEIKAEALPGTRNSLLEDAFCVACSSRAMIEFQFNSVSVEMEAPFTLTRAATRASRVSVMLKENVTAPFERLSHIRRNPI